jgi:hypothetical protein
MLKYKLIFYLYITSYNESSSPAKDHSDSMPFQAALRLLVLSSLPESRNRVDGERKV